MKTHIDGIDRNMTADEIAEHKKIVAAMEALADEHSKHAEEIKTARATAIVKLKALGLTDAEIAALAG